MRDAETPLDSPAAPPTGDRLDPDARPVRHGVVLEPGDAARFARAENRIRAVSVLLDDLIPIPGTTFRIGLDPVLGLVPWVGDAVTGAVGLWIVLEAARFRVPRIVLARMAANVLGDLALGAIPLIGDLLDVAARSNRRNLELFRRHALDPTASTREHRLFFLGVLLSFAGVLWLVWSTAAWLLGLLGEALGSIRL